MKLNSPLVRISSLFNHIPRIILRRSYPEMLRIHAMSNIAGVAHGHSLFGPLARREVPAHNMRPDIFPTIIDPNSSVSIFSTNISRPKPTIVFILFRNLNPKAFRYTFRFWARLSNGVRTAIRTPFSIMPVAPSSCIQRLTAFFYTTNRRHNLMLPQILGDIA